MLLCKQMQVSYECCLPPFYEATIPDQHFPSCLCKCLRATCHPGSDSWTLSHACGMQTESKRLYLPLFCPVIVNIPIFLLDLLFLSKQHSNKLNAIKRPCTRYHYWAPSVWTNSAKSLLNYFKNRSKWTQYSGGDQESLVKVRKKMYADENRLTFVLGQHMHRVKEWSIDGPQRDRNWHIWPEVW